jgi:hypothetical protein
MALPDRRIQANGWQHLLILLAIGSLTLSLATRFSVPLTSQAHGVKSADSRSGEPKRQHLDRDNIRFACPVSTTACIRPVTVDRQVIPVQPAGSSYDLAQSLYNRPPPALFF